MPADILFAGLASFLAIVFATGFERKRQHAQLHPREKGRRRNWIRRKLGLKPRWYRRHKSYNCDDEDCGDPYCPHPTIRGPHSGPGDTSVLPPHDHHHSTPCGQSDCCPPAPQWTASYLDTQPPSPQAPDSQSDSQRYPQSITIQIPVTPEVVEAFFDGLGLRYPRSTGPGAGPAPSGTSAATSAWIDQTARQQPNQPRQPQPRRYKKSALRSRGRAAHWGSLASTVPSRTDSLQLRRWQRMPTGSTENFVPTDRFSKYNVQAEVPSYDDEIYEKHLTNSEWTKEETDYLVNLYRECNGKWPVIVDRYDMNPTRTMEDLKTRFYEISAIALTLETPITSMTAPEYALYETLKNFNGRQETSRKALAEGHMYRKQNEVDEETVLLGELQRIMLNQAALDGEREELRRRLDHPLPSTNGYQYGTSQALTQLWQQLLAADRMKKSQRLRPTGNPAFDGLPSATSARPRDSNAGIPDLQRRNTRDSLPSAAPQSALPAELSKVDMLRFGVTQTTDKLPSGVTFASDRLTKPRIAKSTIQTEKIAAILNHIGVPDLIPLPTPAVIEQFDAIMSKVHTVLDMRKIAEKEEQEIKVRSAEKGSG